MSELTTSGPYSPDGFKDPFSLLGSPDVSGAVREATALSDIRAQIHGTANLFRDLHVSAAESIRNYELRRELEDTQTVLGRWAIMMAHQEFRTVDLARVRNQGNWDATAQPEQEVALLAGVLAANGASEGLIDRDTEQAKRRIMIDPTLVAETGLLLVRRKRLMLATQQQEHRFTDRRPAHGYGSKKQNPSHNPLTTQMRYEIDKVSEFVLDPELLGDADALAGRQAYAIMADGAPQRAVEDGKQPENEALAHIIEGAIRMRHEMLTPVTTTYYADRKYSKVKRLGIDD